MNPVSAAEHPARAPLPYAEQTPPLLREVCWTMFSLLVVSAFYCMVARLVFHKPFPWDWPLFYRNQHFTDFTIYQPKFPLFRQAAFFTTGYPFTYPAPMALLYALLFELPGKEARNAFLLIAALSFAVPAGLFGRALRARGLAPRRSWLLAAIVLFTSWPAALLLDRGNVEVFVWLALVVAVWALVTGRGWVAAAMFGVAASLKLFPFVYLAMFLTRRGFPKLLFGAAVFGLVTLLSLAVLGPTIPIAYHGISAGLATFHDSYMIVYNRDLTGLDHSLMAFVKTCIVAIKQKRYEPDLARVGTVYMPAMAVIGAVLYFWRIRTLPWLNQLVLLSVASILFTPFSGDGTLIHLYYGFALCCFLALNAWKEKVCVPGLRVVLLCYAWLLAFESFEIVGGRRLEGQGKCIGLVVLFVCAMRYPLGAALGRNLGPEEMSRPDAAHIEGVTAVTQIVDQRLRQ